MGVLNVANRELVGLCLERFNSHLNSNGEIKWWQVVQVPRVMIELTNTRVIPVEVLNAFIGESSKLLLGLGGSELGELLATAMLLAIPWLSAEYFNEESLNKLSEFMNNLEKLMTEPERRYTQISKSFDVKVTGFEAFEGDSLKFLFETIRNDPNNFYLNGTFSGKRVSAFKAFEGALINSQSHGDFSIAWSEECLRSGVQQISEFKPLELFSDAFETECCPFSKLFYQFMIHQLIEVYELNHRRGAEVIFSSLPVENLATIEKVLCQVLFGKLLRSRARISVTYYEILLIDCCRLSRLFPPMMARSLLKLVAQMDEKSADLEVLERLAGWFAHHLSHYDFKWNWAEWKEIAENNQETTCKRIFLCLIIQKLLLLSYQEKMQSILPNFMLKMMSSESSGTKPSNKFNSELLEFMKKRPGAEEVREHVAREGISLLETFEVFLFLGSKTFSHLSSATDRYANLFKEAPLADQFFFISCVSEFWADNLQNFHLVIEKLVQGQVLKVEIVIEWLFERVIEIIRSESEDIKLFEFNVLLKYFSIDFLLGLIGCLEENDKTESSQFVRSLIDRLSNLDCKGNFWIQWIAEGLIRTLLREYFLVNKSVEKTEVVLEMKENGSYTQKNVCEMIDGVAKCLTL